MCLVLFITCIDNKKCANSLEYYNGYKNLVKRQYKSTNSYDTKMCISIISEEGKIAEQNKKTMGQKI